MSNPYRIEGPALISFSMGRTSARLLWEILNAHDGSLPADVHVVCLNTGDEDEKSLRFYHECMTRWGALIHLVEFRDNEAGYEVVGLNSASRSGEPFDALIARKRTETSPLGYVPNRGAPYCSTELKARTARDWARGELGWTSGWKVVLGLRYDEKDRVDGAHNRNKSGKDPWVNVTPLYDAKVVTRGVNRFWFGKDRIDLTIPQHLLPQGFDLGLWGFEGNCVFCWKKSLAKRRRLIRLALDRGDTAQLQRWIARERRTGTTFDLKWSMEEICRSVLEEPDFLDLMGELPEDDEGEECGFTCALPDAAIIERGSGIALNRGCGRRAA